MQAIIPYQQSLEIGKFTRLAFTLDAGAVHEPAS
jgi:hypothetical protein